MENPEEYTHIPQLQQVTEAYQEIRNHNKKHTGLAGAIMNTIVAAHNSEEIINDDFEEPISSNTEDQTPTIAEGISDRVTEGDMDAELQDIFHSDTFMRIGIKITPKGSAVSNGEGTQLASTELVPTVENTELFVDFLTSQDPTSFEEDAEALELLSDTLLSLQNSVVAGFTKPKEDVPEDVIDEMREHGVDALRTFLAIDEQYQRLGLRMPAIYKKYLEAEETGMLDESYKNRRKADIYTRSYKELENYVKYWGEDTLEEYIAIGPIDRLSESKAWVIDGMQDRFDKEIDSIIQLIGPEKTTNLGIEAANAELVGIRTALHEMDDPDNWMNKVPGSRELFEKRIQRLQSVIGDENTDTGR